MNNPWHPSARAWAVTAVALAAIPAHAADHTQEVVPGARFKAGGFHDWVLGKDYRALWAAPVVLEVLDLQTEGGGLSPVRRVGGQETKGLALKGKDGRNYTFRGLD